MCVLEYASIHVVTGFVIATIFQQSIFISPGIESLVINARYYGFTHIGLQATISNYFYLI